MTLNEPNEAEFICDITSLPQLPPNPLPNRRVAPPTSPQPLTPPWLQAQRTPAHYASLSGHAATVRLLLENKADVNAVNEVSQPLLMSV